MATTTKNATHTPGPWKVVRPEDDLPSVMTMHGEPICDVYEHGAPGGQYNADLIAAAPELLKVADLVYDAVDMMMDGPDDSDVAYAQARYEEAFKLAREVRKKARGE